MIDKLITWLGGEDNTVAFAVAAGVLGFIAKSIYDLWLTRRKDKLDRVTGQLRDLYGPLFSLVSAASTTWEAFRQQYAAGPEFQSPRGGIAPQTAEAAQVWRHWMKEVFMPLNARMADLVVDRADLLEEPKIPPPLLALCAHVHGYRGVLSAWPASDYGNHMSLTPFPEDLYAYAQSTYERLKRRQERLLGHRPDFPDAGSSGSR
jgi:hypothetical protein